MAKKNISAAKRVRQDQKKKLYNKSYTSDVKTRIKSFMLSLKEGSIVGPTSQKELFEMAMKNVDKMKSRGIWHVNKVARYKSRLQRAFNPIAAKGLSSPATPAA